MKPKLFIHIGTHKTASTVIQNALDVNRNALRAAGLLYPSTRRGSFPELPKHDRLFETLIDPAPAAFDAEFAAFMDEFEASGCTAMIISEEALSEPHFDRFMKLRRFADHFDMRVICYLRRPDFFIESLWNQRCKEGICKTHVGPFVKAPFNRRRVLYDEILDWWSAFADVHAVNYENVKSGQVVSSFSDAIGHALPAKENPILNASPSAQCALLMSGFNALEKRFDRAKLIAAFADDRQKHALGMRLREELLDGLSAHLDRLEQRYGVQFDRDMPDEPQFPMTQLKPRVCANAFASLM